MYFNTNKKFLDARTVKFNLVSAIFHKSNSITHSISFIYDNRQDTKILYSVNFTLAQPRNKTEGTVAPERIWKYCNMRGL